MVVQHRARFPQNNTAVSSINVIGRSIAYAAVAISDVFQG
jgi:hypothetical protein